MVVQKEGGDITFNWACAATNHRPGPSPMLRRSGSSVPNVALSDRDADLAARRSGGDAMATGSCTPWHNGGFNVAKDIAKGTCLTVL